MIRLTGFLLLRTCFFCWHAVLANVVLQCEPYCICPACSWVPPAEINVLGVGGREALGLSTIDGRLRGELQLSRCSEHVVEGGLGNDGHEAARAVAEGRAPGCSTFAERRPGLNACGERIDRHGRRRDELGEDVGDGGRCRGRVDDEGGCGVGCWRRRTGADRKRLRGFLSKVGIRTGETQGTPYTPPKVEPEDLCRT